MLLKIQRVKKIIKQKPIIMAHDGDRGIHAIRTNALQTNAHRIFLRTAIHKCLRLNTRIQVSHTLSTCNDVLSSKIKLISDNITDVLYSFFFK